MDTKERKPVTIREMQTHEAPQVLAGQRKAFSPTFTLFLSKPKRGIVAEIEGKIVGAVTYDMFSTSTSSPVGYLDIAYVDKDYREWKLGSQLYKAAMDTLKEKGCTAITALVRDDNRPSWRIMEKEGAAETSFFQQVNTLGLPLALKLYFSTHQAYALGHYLWMTGTVKTQQSRTSFSYAFIFLFLLLLLATRGNVTIAIGGLIMYLCELAFGYIGTVKTQAQWELKRPYTASPLYIFIAFVGGFLPPIISWHPKEGTFLVSNHAKLIARSGISSWIGVLFATLIAFVLRQQHVVPLVAFGAQTLGVMLLLYRVIKIFPFESYGGMRVFSVNKVWYTVLTILSIPLIVLYFI